MKEVLLATLGTAPQVITLVLDSLRAQGSQIEEAVVLHMSRHTPRVKDAVDVLQGEMAFYRRQGVALKLVEFTDEKDRDLPVVDTLQKSDADAVFRVLFQQLKSLKSKKRRVHLSIAGGRKTMSAFGLVAAQMLFDQHDCCWHLLSEDRVVDDGRLHGAQGDQIALVPVPVLRWCDLSLDAFALARSDDPFAVVASTEARLRERREQRRAFEQTLTPTQKRIFEVLARDGYEAPRIAAELGMTTKNVQNRRGEVLNAYIDFSGENDADYSRLVARFAPVMDGN